MIDTSDDPRGLYVTPLGVFVRSCPTALARSPAVGEAWRAWRWWENGCLADRFPDGIPIILCRAVEELAAGYNAAMAELMKPPPGKGAGDKSF